ncbi:MAG: PfkB family carbohydrate kinase, partial [Planctomycetota bacterium]
MDAPAKPHVTIVGSANVDFIMRLPALPGRGETVTGGEFAQVFGGKGANSAVAAARAASPGMTVGFVARLGTDAFAEVMRRDFAAAGLDVTHVGTDPDVPSGTALVMVGGDGENYLSVAPGSNARLTPGHVDAAADVIAASSVLLTQMEVPAETVRR